jgi:hypothetical protein
MSAAAVRVRIAAPVVTPIRTKPMITSTADAHSAPSPVSTEPAIPTP